MKSILFLIAFLSAFFVNAQNMTNTKMDRILHTEATNVEGETGVWQIMYGGRLLLVITDSTANRMRIFTPVLETRDLEPGQKEKMLEANFHSALDAKYSLYQGFVMSAFTHPLKELTEEQLKDALKQVFVLAETFGTAYQSTDLIYGSGQESEEPKINQSPKEKKN
ncbi:MAG: hypothetical protein AAFZ15_17140 [Bacteroidota bacterium]